MMAAGSRNQEGAVRRLESKSTVYRVAFDVWWDKDDLPLKVFKHMLAWPAMQQGLRIRVRYEGRLKFKVLVEGDDETSMRAYMTYVTVGTPVLGDVSPLECTTHHELVLSKGSMFVNLEVIREEEKELSERHRRIESSGIVEETDESETASDRSVEWQDAQELV